MVVITMKGKTVILLGILGLLVVSSSLAGMTTVLPAGDPGFPAPSEKGHSVTTSFHFDAVDMSDNGDYIALESGEGRHLAVAPGAPSLPYASTTLHFPLGTTINGVHIKTGEVSTLSLEKKIAPGPSPVLLSHSVQGESREMGPLYKSAELYPSSWVSYRTGAGLAGNERVLFLTLYAYPARYAPARDEMLTVRQVEVTVEVTPPSRPVTLADDYDLLILCPQGWEGDLAPLRDHKESRGLATVVVSLAEVTGGTYFEVQGRDEAEQVKYFIKDAVEQWGITYVLIVGGYDEFPMRKSWVYDESEIGWIDIPIPTDLYYADLYTANGSFSSWDTNNNGYFGELDRPGEEERLYDEVDLYPDVYIGRLACESQQSVATVADKIITYENTASGSRWFNRVLLVAGDTSPNDGYGDVDEGIILTEESLQHLDGFTPLRLYPGRLIPQLKLNPFTISAGLTLGVGLSHFAGHGNMVAWSTHPHGDPDTWVGQYGNSVIATLNNGHRLPVIRIGACLCGALDYSRDSCFAWAFVKQEGGGAIATVASTRLSWGYIGEYVNRGLGGYHGVLFFKGYEEGTTPARMLASAQNEYLNTIHMPLEARSKYDYKTVEEYILFGDPSLKIGGYP
ncbi:MAG TPA: hypothetical protein ENN54_06190 [Thermoplasmatales archaeon]|nr:hypothetical protein [Thermoplasmatales archaeon]